MDNIMPLSPAVSHGFISTNMAKVSFKECDKRTEQSKSSGILGMYIVYFREGV